MRKEIFSFFFLFLLFFLENNLFILFSFPLNLVLIYIFFSSLFFEKKLALAIAIAGGVLLDIFSEKFFGFYLLISLFIFFLVEYLLKKYVKI